MWTEAQQAALDIKLGCLVLYAGALLGLTAVLLERIFK